jgi:hypothetical protein
VGSQARASEATAAAEGDDGLRLPVIDHQRVLLREVSRLSGGQIERRGVELAANHQGEKVDPEGLGIRHLPLHPPLISIFFTIVLNLLEKVRVAVLLGER